MIPFTPCVHLWEHSSLTAVYNYTESNSWTQQHHKQQTANSKQQTAYRTRLSQGSSKWRGERKDRRGRGLGVSRGGNERWHAGHLNAKAEGIDSVSASPVCKLQWWPCLNWSTVPIPDTPFLPFLQCWTRPQACLAQSTIEHHMLEARLSVLCWVCYSVPWEKKKDMCT